MALPRIEAVITADTKQAEAGFTRVERGLEGVGNAADRAGARTTAMGAAVRATGGKSSSFARGIQNASFQLGDFATQVGAGTSASIALGQQLPQLLGGFGILGAVLGAVVAIAVPLTRAFQGMSESGADLSQVLGVLAPMADTLADAFRTVAQIGVQMAELIINNLDRILITAGLVAGFFAAKWVGAFVAARIATMSLSGALVMLRGALIRTGIGALIVGAGELVYQFTRLVQAAGSFGEALGLLKDVFVEVWERIKTVGAAGIDYLIGQFMRMQAAFTNAIAQMAAKASDFFFGLSEGLRSSGVEPLMKMGDAFGRVSKNIGQVGGSLSRTAYNQNAEAEDRLASAQGGFADATAPLQSVQKIRDLLASIKDDRITLPDLLGVGAGEEDGGGGGGGKSAKEKLEEELSDQEKRIREHFDRIAALTQGGLSDKLGAWGSYFQNLVTLTGTNNDKLLAMAKAATAAQALMDAWGAYNRVLNSPGLAWYARAAAAGQVLAAGLGAVNAIKGVSTSGGGGAGAGGAAGGSAAAAGGGGRRDELDVRVNVIGDLDTASNPNVINTITEGILENLRDRDADIVRVSR